MGAVVEKTDGTWAVIKAKDLLPGVKRSRCMDTVDEAWCQSDWLALPLPGPKSQEKYVRVKLKDLGAAQITPAKPAKSIPDYPHRCHVCGGNMLILFSSVEHEGGACPGEPGKRRGRYA